MASFTLLSPMSRSIHDTLQLCMDKGARSCYSDMCLCQDAETALEMYNAITDMGARESCLLILKPMARAEPQGLFVGSASSTRACARQTAHLFPLLRTC